MPCTFSWLANLYFHFRPNKSIWRLSFITWDQITCKVKDLSTAFCETQPPASIGWVALSSVFVCRSFVVTHRWHLLSSPPYDVSEHTNYIFSVRIWSWQHVSVNISSVAELSPVYCCLVVLCKAINKYKVKWDSRNFLNPGTADCRLVGGDRIFEKPYIYPIA